jgi:hypothetical protein
MAKTPLLHLEEGLFLQVDGEEEKNHSISWDLLKKIGDNTQALITKLAKYSLEETPFDEESVKLDFVGFHPGSAVPQFRVHDAVQSNMFPVKKVYKTLNADFTFVVSHLADGNFQAIADRYTEPSVKNDIIETVYEFSNSVGTKPFRVVRPNKQSKNGFRSVAKLRPITPVVKKMLRVSEDQGISKKAGVIDSIEAIGKVSIKTTPTGKKTTKLGHLYTQKEAALSLRFDSIETNKRTYILAGEILFNINEDKKSVSIESPLLDIYAFGQNEEEAKNDLSEQFDYTFQRLNDIEDTKLSAHLLKAKQYINIIVERVKEK